jgi:hypothetical protein
MISCMESDKPLKINFVSLPDQSVYWQGWVKYFHYNNNTRFERPRTFYQNNEYFHQRIPNYLYHESDHLGTMRVPSKKSFFLVVYNNSLVFYSTRYTIYGKSYDTLRIDNINLVPEDQPLKGGIKDLGNFDEGYCLELKATIPRFYRNNFNPLTNFKGLFQTWVICNSNETSKQKLLHTLLRIKVKSQRNRGALLTYDSINKNKKGRKANISFGRKKPIRGKPVDGHWVLYQNWTECTLKCGGGKSYQQWLCISPKNGGRPCKGFSVKVRSCNQQKCPSNSVVLKKHLKRKKREEENAGAPMIIKVAPFSTRPQRYIKCFLKESDAFLSSYDPKSRITSKQPLRIVMNNQTISLYSDDEYENKIYTYNLPRTSISRVKDFCCINLRDSMRSSKLCGFDANCGTRLNNKWVEDWIKDFNLFRNDCRTKKQISYPEYNKGGYPRRGKKKGDNIGELFDETLGKSSYSDTLSLPAQPNQMINIPGALPALPRVPPKKPKNEIQRQAQLFKTRFAQDLQAKIINKREKKIMKKVIKANKKVARGKVMKTENMGLAVMGKEMELEKLIKKEEKKRENRQMKKLKKIMKKEKKKATCLKKSIKRRQLDTQILLEKREAEKEINHVKEEIKMAVQMKRNEMKRQISLMRKRSRRRRAALETKINRFRSKMALRIMETNRCGDIEHCIKGKKSPSQRDTYCNTNFVDDYLKNYDCKTEDSFCYMCCENEFGYNFYDKREECYDMCDGQPLKKSTIRKRKLKMKMMMKKKAKKSSPTPIDVLGKKGFKAPPKKKIGGWVWVPWKGKKRN